MTQHTLLNEDEVIVSRDGVEQNAKIVRYAGMSEYLLEINFNQEEVHERFIIAKVVNGYRIDLRREGEY